MLRNIISDWLLERICITLHASITFRNMSILGNIVYISSKRSIEYLNDSSCI